MVGCAFEQSNEDGAAGREERECGSEELDEEVCECYLAVRRKKSTAGAKSQGLMGVRLISNIPYTSFKFTPIMLKFGGVI